MKILLIYYGEKDINIDRINFDKKIYIKKKPYYDFTQIKDTIKNYDYLIFLDDNWDYTKSIEGINKSINLIKDYGQIIFNKNSINELNVKKYKENTQNYDIYKSITRSNRIFTNLTKKDMKQSNNIDYEEYVNNDFKKNHFKLEPSIINIKKYLLDGVILKKNEHIEYLYGRNLSDFNVVYLNMCLKSIKNDKVLIDNRDGENITIVTGFLKLDIKRPPKKNTPNQIYDYIDKAKNTLMIPQKMVIYLTNESVDIVKKIRSEIGMIDKTKIIVITKEKNLYMNNRIEIINKNVKKNNSPYNIGEYICAVNSRYSYLEDTIKNNYFRTDYFAWIDFSAGHIVDIPKNMKITYSQHEKVRIAWIARYKNGFLYNHYCLGGGIFVGYKTIMMELIKLHDEKFKELMNMGYNINDDKLLFTIMERYPYLFDTYFSGYKSMYVKI